MSILKLPIKEKVMIDYAHSLKEMVKYVIFLNLFGFFEFLLHVVIFLAYLVVWDPVIIACLII
jgi:hypothetical protein